MLDLETRTGIFRLRREGHGTKKIARSLGVSRNAVRRVVRSGAATVLALVREEGLAPHIDRFRELHVVCQGNLVRVAEELEAEGTEAAYSTPTAFCRRHEIGAKPKQRVGQHHLEAGEEMQHDTSPPVVEVGGRKLRLQCASIVLCDSRLRYAPVLCAVAAVRGPAVPDRGPAVLRRAARTCMLDNSHVIVRPGTGRDAVMAPEMVAFADRFGFTFTAHRIGDANRSARVERPFHEIERNFYPGRTFSNLDDLNARFLG